MVETMRSSAEHPIDEDIDRVIQSSKKEQDEYQLYLVAHPKEGQDALYEDNAEIKIENRTISFKGLFLKDAEGKDEKRLSNISNFYVNRTDDGIQIFSTGETTPRLYLHNDGIVEGRANSQDTKFNIKFNGAGKLFETLRVLLDHDYEKYKTPERATDFTGKGFSIEQNTSLGKASFRINGGNALLSGFILYDSKSKKWEKIPNITNFYIKKDSNNTLSLYSNDDDNPKLIIRQDGIVKGTLPNNNELSYGAKEHSALWKVIRSELNGKYQSYRHEKVNIQSEPTYINYTTKEEYKYRSKPIEAGSGINPNTFDDTYARSHRKNNRNNADRVSDNLEWQYINETFRNVEILDIDNYIFGSGVYIGKNTNLHVSSIAKEGKTLILNKGAIEITDKNGDLRFKYRNNRNDTVTFNSSTIGATGKSGTKNNQREHIYKTLDRKYFS